MNCIQVVLLLEDEWTRTRFYHFRKEPQGPQPLVRAKPCPIPQSSFSPLAFVLTLDFREAEVVMSIVGTKPAIATPGRRAGIDLLQTCATQRVKYTDGRVHSADFVRST